MSTGFAAQTKGIALMALVPVDHVPMSESDH